MPQKALQFLKDVSSLEDAEIIVRLPSSWKRNRPLRPKVKATIGSQSPSALGFEALMDCNIGMVVDGEELSPEDINDILKKSLGLHLIKGKWVEIDIDKLKKT